MADVQGRLAGKRALVVGGGQTPGETIGNGRAVAVLFARAGAEVVVVDRRQDSADQTVALITDEGGRATAIACDIAAGEEAVAAMVAAAVEQLGGGLDIVHNNVGIGAGDNTPQSLEVDAWDRILDVNLKSMWLTCKHAVPVLRASGGGAIVNISSVAAVASAGRLTAYKISKAGVNALTHNLAVTNARHGVRANAIMPGFIDTPMAVDAPSRAAGRSREEYAAGRAAQVPLGRQGTAWDVAHLALFLASDEAGFISGQVIAVDGGQSAKIG